MRRDRAKERLHELIQVRLQSPARAPEVDELIWKKYGRQLAILVSDQSGFTRLTKTHGIIHFLCLYHRLLELSTPLIISSGGSVVKTEADNILAAFESPLSAIETAVKMHQAAASFNQTAEPDFQLYHCIGISCGDVIRTDHDVFGDPVNTAYKLGEDVAGRGEVLVCEKTHTAIGGQHRFGPKQEAKVGNIKLDYHRLIY